MAFWKIVKGIWDPQARAESIIETQVCIYNQIRAQHPERDRNAWLALTLRGRPGWMGRDEMFYYTETALFSLAPPTQAPIALGLYLLHKEAPILAPAYAPLFDRIMQPIFELAAKGGLEERWRNTNPWTAGHHPLVALGIKMARGGFGMTPGPPAASQGGSMASNGKKQATAASVGWALLMTAFDPARDECKRQIQSVVDKLPQEMDTGRAVAEVICLRAFAAEFAAVMALGPGPQSLAVLDAFHKAWEEMAKTDPEWAGLYEFFRQRGEEYRGTLRQEHPNGHVYLIGRAFAEACGYPRAATVMLNGCHAFVTTHQAVAAAVKDFDIAA